MPKPTFFNLPDAKRDRLVDLAIDEFAAHPYRQASLSRIVAAAGIAKGSVYQYFDNKLDLYTWLVTEEMVRRKLAAIATGAPAPGASIWDTLRAAFLAGFHFAMAEPRLTALGTHLLRDGGDPELQPLVASHRTAAHAWMTHLLTTAQQQGEVRADLDLDTTATLLAQTLGEGMLHVLARRLGVDLPTYLANPAIAEQLSDDEVLALVDSALDFLRGGLAAREA